MPDLGGARLSIAVKVSSLIVESADYYLLLPFGALAYLSKIFSISLSMVTVRSAMIVG